MHGAKAGNPIPTVGNLVAIARAARDLGWLKGPMSADARSLAQWLLSQERKQRAEMQNAASQALDAFIDDLMVEVDFRLYDVEEALESLFDTFATGVAKHVRRASTSGGEGLSEAVRKGSEAAIAAVSARLVELADQVEANEFAPVAPACSSDTFLRPHDADELIRQQEATEPSKTHLARVDRRR